MHRRKWKGDRDENQIQEETNNENEEVDEKEKVALMTRAPIDGSLQLPRNIWNKSYLWQVNSGSIPEQIDYSNSCCLPWKRTTGRSLLASKEWWSARSYEPFPTQDRRRNELAELVEEFDKAGGSVRSSRTRRPKSDDHQKAKQEEDHFWRPVIKKDEGRARTRTR